MSKIKVSVPGKIMLAGEYAVLSGHRALALTVGRHLNVFVERSLSQSTIGSSIWQKTYQLDTPPADLQNAPLFETAKWAMDTWQLPAFHLNVCSDIRIEDGIGSSSALRLAVLLGLFAFKGSEEGKDPFSLIDDNKWSIARSAWQLQLGAQRKASGYDIATQLLGGLVTMKPELTESSWPGDIESTQACGNKQVSQWITIMRGGKGAPTTEVMGRTLQWLQQKGLESTLVKLSERTIDAFMNFFKSSMQQGFDDLIYSVASLRKIFEPSPDFPTSVHKALKTLAGIDNHWTYKTTGAGGEDALLLIGHPDYLKAPTKILESHGWSRLDAPLMVGGAKLSQVED